MKFLAPKKVVSTIIIFFVVTVISGCATQHRSSIEPPPRLQKELDSISSDTVTRKSLKSTRYTIKKGDTIWRIAYNYGVSPDSIIKLNHINDVTNIKQGQRLIIPVGIASIQKKPSKTTLTTRTKRSRESFIWPLRGKILSGFGRWAGGDKNTGIDIQTVYGQAVKASKGGIVALTSDTPDGWGKVVILQHDDDSYTWYAYNSKILVKKGDKVGQGQTIARAGSTGRAKQDKLHFKIFLHSMPVNPTHYLH